MLELRVRPEEEEKPNPRLNFWLEQVGNKIRLRAVGADGTEQNLISLVVVEGFLRLHRASLSPQTDVAKNTLLDKLSCIIEHDESV